MTEPEDHRPLTNAEHHAEAERLLASVEPHHSWESAQTTLLKAQVHALLALNDRYDHLRDDDYEV